MSTGAAVQCVISTFVDSVARCATSSASTRVESKLRSARSMARSSRKRVNSSSRVTVLLEDRVIVLGRAAMLGARPGQPPCQLAVWLLDDEGRSSARRRGGPADAPRGAACAPPFPRPACPAARAVGGTRPTAAQQTLRSVPQWAAAAAAEPLAAGSPADLGPPEAVRASGAALDGGGAPAGGAPSVSPPLSRKDGLPADAWPASSGTAPLRCAGGG
eukprot:CAMPEP_0175335292 /NCGR_PEP_ID=MMETSP0095-20121207/3223_1 /TAXON_ID=311494 /ORGANISM="Alexandrium monilatum, Strain CCMP3105" /LENGTH=216 /DNA_ID=CAMNT_0016632617 /DNA_START=265 /DNA_END=911 /DNA_ORIENTATION=-